MLVECMLNMILKGELRGAMLRIRSISDKKTLVEVVKKRVVDIECEEDSNTLRLVITLKDVDTGNVVDSVEVSFNKYGRETERQTVEAVCRVAVEASEEKENLLLQHLLHYINPSNNEQQK